MIAGVCWEICSWSRGIFQGLCWSPCQTQQPWSQVWPAWGISYEFKSLTYCHIWFFCVEVFFLGVSDESELLLHVPISLFTITSIPLYAILIFFLCFFLHLGLPDAESKVLSWPLTLCRVIYLSPCKSESKSKSELWSVLAILVSFWASQELKKWTNWWIILYFSWWTGG